MEHYCRVCNKPISLKATFCSDAHRKQYERRTKVGQTPDKSDTKMNPDNAVLSDLELTRTDSLFARSKPGYYKFSEDVKSDKCLQCGKDFKTRLPLLRHCSPQHMLDTLNSLTK